MTWLFWWLLGLFCETKYRLDSISLCWNLSVSSTRYCYLKEVEAFYKNDFILNFKYLFLSLKIYVVHRATFPFCGDIWVFPAMFIAQCKDLSDRWKSHVLSETLVSLLNTKRIFLMIYRRLWYTVCIISKSLWMLLSTSLVGFLSICVYIYVCVFMHVCIYYIYYK